MKKICVVQVCSLTLAGQIVQKNRAGKIIVLTIDIASSKKKQSTKLELKLAQTIYR